MTFNELLWWPVNHLGWLFWAPMPAYGLVVLYQITHMAPASSRYGRVVRVLICCGAVGLVFIPFFNGLGPYAAHVAWMGVILINNQLVKACRAAGKIQPPQSETMLGRLAERLVDVPDRAVPELRMATGGRREH